MKTCALTCIFRLMKTAFLILVILSLPIDSFAQQQNGYVKTRGRLADDGSVISGSRLSGATVVLKGGNSTVSDSQGDFTLTVSGKYYLQNIKKQGYIVSDPDILSKSYSYSANDLVLVLDTPTQQADDCLANERKIRRTLQRQLQQREDEIEDLKAQNKITQEEYRQALQKLYSDQENNEKLISDMAERYSRIDYDQIDEFNRLFSSYILNGELTKADSLLRTKGDLKSDIESYRRLQSANKQERDELARRQENLDKSEAYEQFKLNDLAQFCEQKAELFKMQNQNDSVAYYYETRASLDTTNIDWLLTAGKYINEYIADYEKGRQYYHSALRQSLLQYGENNEKTAICLCNLGVIYSNIGDFSKSIDYSMKSINVYKNLFEKDNYQVACVYNNLGVIYSYLGQYNKSLMYLEKSLGIKLAVLGENHPEVALNYNNIGFTYAQIDEKAKALDYYAKALTIDEVVYGHEHHVVATDFNNLGEIYSDLGEIEMSLDYHCRSLDIRRCVFGENHPDVAQSYNNIGGVLSSRGDNLKALECYEKSLNIRLRIFGENHRYIASLYNNMGVAYGALNESKKAIDLCIKALKINLLIFGDGHLSVANNYFNIGEYYYRLNDNKNAIDYFRNSLRVYVKQLGAESIKVKTTILSILTCYRNLLKLDDKFDKSYIDFMANILIICDMAGGDTPAARQGLIGQYFLLAYEDWNMESHKDLFEYNGEMRGKPKTLVLLQNGVISSHYFENSIGCQFGVKWVTKEEKQDLLKQYHDWKAKQ